MHPSGTAVVIVNWNGLAHTRDCLRSLEAVREEWSACIVVDNGSTDGSAEALSREFPWARVVQAGANLGYAGGNNLGMKLALEDGADWLFLLNNDATVAEGSVARLREAVASDSNVAFAGPLVYRADQPERFWYAGGKLTRRPFRVREITRPAMAEATEAVPVDYVPGCAVFLSRAVAEEIGLLDERFFLTWEDTDWSARAAERGRGRVVVPRAKVWHVGSQSFDGFFSPLYGYYYFRNMMLFARLHFSPSERWRAYRDVFNFARVVFVRCWQEERGVAIVPAAWLGFLHYAAGRFGPAPRFLASGALAGKRPSSQSV